MNNFLNKVLCAECRSLQPYDIRTEQTVRSWNGADYAFNKRIAICKKCGNQVTVPGLSDLNENDFESKCRIENDYILVDEIEAIIEKYDIEKRPLSRVLGLGEHTIENYLKGQLPSKRYSDMLRRVLTSYLYMKEFYDSNKDSLTKLSADRLEKKLDYYDQINSHNSMIETVAIYILNSKYEITNMSLQKLLYYVEAFTEVLLHKRLFDNRCEAWIYGPVYPEIYNKYKSFGKAQIIIDEANLSDSLDSSITDIIDFVLSQFAIYNGVTLKDLSHAEAPWKNAHAGYAAKEHCTEQISHEAITDYFTAIHKKYNLSKDSGVKKYIASLGII